MTDVVIYRNKSGNIELNVNLSNETVWLTQKQLAQLFDKNVRTISEHISNIFKEDELDKTSVIQYFRITAEDGKTYETSHYNLDVIISVGYRVHSKQGVAFRQWATQVLKQHLIQGYTTHKKRLAECGIQELQQTVELLEKTLVRQALVNDLGQAAIQLIINYTKTWGLLLAYDENRLPIPQKALKNTSKLTYQQAIEAISALKTDLAARQEASNLFGRDRENKLEGILNSLEQTFDSKPLYSSTEEKAAHLLYFVIKDHPFVDGNKRIGSLLFLLYLTAHGLSPKLNDNGIVALTLLVAESAPTQKELMIRLMIHMLVD